MAVASGSGGGGCRMSLPHDCKLLQYDKRWERIAPAGLFCAQADAEDAVSLPGDATALALQQLEAVSLQALFSTCCAAREAGRSILACFDEAVFRDICGGHGWSAESLTNVGVYVSNSRHFTPCPPWLSRLSKRLMQPHHDHMTTGVVAKVLDAVGPVDARRSSLGGGGGGSGQRYRRLFVAHVKHRIGAHQPLITPADVQSLEGFLHRSR